MEGQGSAELSPLGRGLKRRRKGEREDEGVGRNWVACGEQSCSKGSGMGMGMGGDDATPLDSTLLPAHPEHRRRLPLFFLNTLSVSLLRNIIKQERRLQRPWTFVSCVFVDS